MTSHLTKRCSMRQTVDVLIAGGGPAGFAAAVAAARHGARTLLVESNGCLGGMGTSALVGPFMRTIGTEGIFDELRDRLADMGGLAGTGHNWDRWAFDAETLKFAMQRMAEEAGVELLLCSAIVKAHVADGRVTGVQVANKAGLMELSAAVVVDATGDGDVAATAGAVFDKGDDDGAMQAVTLFFTIGGVDEQALKTPSAAYPDFWTNMPVYIQQEREAGRLNLPPHVNRIWMIWKGSTLADGEYSINIDTAVGVDATDPWQVSKAMNESRERVFEVVAFLQKYMWGGGNIHLVKTGAVLGVRETRRVRGVATLTGEDVVSGRKRPVDGIGRASYSIDLHDDGRDGPKAKQVFGRETPPAGDWYEIPYGCLVPEGVDGLLVAGRCLSSDRWANGSLRIMPTCMATGQAAGVAAALCARDGIQPRHLEVERLRGVLRDGVGVILDQAAVHSNLNPEP